MPSIITGPGLISLSASILGRKHHLNRLRQLHQWPLSLVDRKQNDLYNGVVPKIGLEVHAQLNVKSKLFSQGGTSSEFPNTQLDLFDIALPGSLPTLNLEALKTAILASLALNCTIQDVIHFDRKNYFYSDMPAGFQITQYHKPLAIGGFLDYIVTPYQKSYSQRALPYDLSKELWRDENYKKPEEFVPYLGRCHITQIQLEQDSAKTLHQMASDFPNEELYTLIDYNRAGIGLIEVVFEPELVNHHEASSLIRELIRIFQSTNVCDCEMQLGNLRVDANISIQSIGNQEIKSERVELKNLNSVKFVNKALFHEIKRQAGIIKAGGKVVRETRCYDPKSGQTASLRLKETAVDYRYMPEPNIPPLKLEPRFVNEVAEDLPQKMPSKTLENLISHENLDLELAAQFLDDPKLLVFFEHIIKLRPNLDINLVADFLIYTKTKLDELPINLEESQSFMDSLDPSFMAEVLDLLVDDVVSYVVAYDLAKFRATNFHDKSSANDLVERFGWFQINDPKEVDKYCREVVNSMLSVPKKYAKRGYKKDLRRLLDKANELTEDRISIRKAILSFNELLRKNKSVD